MRKTVASVLGTSGLLGLLAFGAVPNQAEAITFSASSGNLSASASFTNVGGNLQVVLTNTSASDVLIPAEVLTAVFFDVQGAGALTPLSALLSGGSTVFFGPDGGGNVGGEWAYGSGLAGAPLGATLGISSSGLGLFGNANFNGANLQGPVAVDGLQYGITSAGDNTATGNAAVTGGNALIKNQVTFLLTGLGGIIPGQGNITNVSFQYGTALTEPNVPVPPVPEPSTLLMLGSAFVGMCYMSRRSRKDEALSL